VTEMDRQSPTVEFFTASPGQPRLAYLFRPARPDCQLPGLVWLGGFGSDMRGAKASFLDEMAQAQGRACLRFDYSGHGESEAISPRAPSGSGPPRLSRSFAP